MTWDVTTPAGTESIRSGDDRIRELKVDIEAALTAHGSFPGSDVDNPVYRPIPAGATIEYAGSSAPTGWLMCDGTAVSRTTYAELFTAIGTTYGSGDGSTTFNVPDCRGKSVFGKAASGTFQTLGGTGGAETHTHSQPAHTHDVGTINMGTPDNTVAAGSGAGSAGSSLHRHALAGSTASSQPAIASSSSLAPYIVLNKIIKT